jgi:hypothetical protein
VSEYACPRRPDATMYPITTIELMIAHDDIGLLIQAVIDMS